jgi:L-aspartate oxidase
MGSNSLLEGLVLGRRAGERAAAESSAASPPAAPPQTPAAAAVDSTGLKLSIEDMTYSLKSLMWRNLGIVRSGASLADALERLEFWHGAVRRLAPPELRAFELSNMLTVARLVALSAAWRAESRGTHFRSDFPAVDPSWRVHTLVTPVRQGGRLRSAEITSEPVRTRATQARTATAAVAKSERGALR